MFYVIDWPTAIYWSIRSGSTKIVIGQFLFLAMLIFIRSESWLKMIDIIMVWQEHLCGCCLLYTYILKKSNSWFVFVVYEGVKLTFCSLTSSSCSSSSSLLFVSSTQTVSSGITTH